MLVCRARGSCGVVETCAAGKGTFGASDVGFHEVQGVAGWSLVKHTFLP